MLKEHQDQLEQGLHLFKVFCLLALTQAHSLIWIGAAYHERVSSHRFWFHGLHFFSGTFLTFSWLFPFLGGAIFRATLAPSIRGGRLHVDHLRSFWSTFIFCSLLESTKHALSYSLVYFSLWGCVHTITLTFVVIAWIASRSIGWLYGVTVLGLLSTPFLVSKIAPFEFDERNVPDVLLNVPTLKIFLLSILGALFVLLLYKTLNSGALKSKFRLRVAGVLTLLAVSGGYLVSRVSETMSNKVFIGNLWNGVLVGTERSYFLWALFPWAFAVMIGFLTFGWVLQMKQSRKFNLLLIWAGLTVLYLSNKFVAYDQLSPRANATIMLSPELVNRGGATFFLSLSLFLIFLPLFVELSKLGMETPWIKSCSRSYFWIYLFQTSVGVLLPLWTKDWIPLSVNVYLLPTFLTLCCFIIPWIIDRLPGKVSITLQPVE